MDENTDWATLGDSLLDEEKYEDAIKAYEKAVETNPGDYQSWFNKGDAHLSLDQNEEAIKANQKVIELMPDFIEGWNNMSVAYGNLGKNKEAIFFCEKTLELNPNYETGWYNKGRLLQKTGDNKSALKSLDQALKINPKNTNALLRKCQIFLNSEHYTESIGCLNKILDLDKNNPEAWYYLGCAFEKTGKVQDAIAAFRKVISFNVNDFYITLKLGYLLSENGAVEEGCELIKQNCVLGLGQRLILNKTPIELSFWNFIDSKDDIAGKKNANKFFLACILDYQMEVKYIWTQARDFAEKILGDPDNLWEVITSESFEDWKSKWRVYKLHRFPYAHERVWVIGKKIVEQYNGDVRNIWKNKDPDTIMHDLFNLVSGNAIPRMIMGALFDLKQIPSCRLDVKPDVHVCTVLARALYGLQEKISEHEALEITRKMAPEPLNPWHLDQQLYLIGIRICKARKPKCEKCYLADICAYHHDLKLPITK